MTLPFWSPPGEISEYGCWVWVVRPYLYVGDSVWGVLWARVCGDERDLVG